MKMLKRTDLNTEPWGTSLVFITEEKIKLIFPLISHWRLLRALRIKKKKKATCCTALVQQLAGISTWFANSGCELRRPFAPFVRWHGTVIIPFPEMLPKRLGQEWQKTHYHLLEEKKSAYTLWSGPQIKKKKKYFKQLWTPCWTGSSVTPALIPAAPLHLWWQCSSVQEITHCDLV